jgi:hypothetical protein
MSQNPYDFPNGTSFYYLPIGSVTSLVRSFDSIERGFEVPFMHNLLGTKKSTHIRFGDEEDDDENYDGEVQANMKKRKTLQDEVDANVNDFFVFDRQGCGEEGAKEVPEKATASLNESQCKAMNLFVLKCASVTGKFSRSLSEDLDNSVQALPAPSSESTSATPVATTVEKQKESSRDITLGEWESANQQSMTIPNL